MKRWNEALEIKQFAVWNSPPVLPSELISFIVFGLGTALAGKALGILIDTFTKSAVGSG